MVLYGITLMINIFDMIIYQRYLETFLGKRKTTAEQAIVLLMTCAIAGSIVNQMHISWFNLITATFILFGYTFQYEEGIIIKSIAVMFYMGIIAVAEPAGYIIYRIFISEFLTNETAVYYFIVLFIELFRMLVVEVLCKLKERKAIQISALPGEIIFILSVIPLMSLISCFLIIEIAKKLMSAQLVVMCMCIIFTIIIVNYLVFIMVNKYSIMAENRHEDEMLLSEIKYKDEYYRDVEYYYEQINDIKHDMKNRLIAFYDSALEGDTSIRERLREMMEDIKQAEDVLYSSNPVLNSILKVKTTRAREYGISMNIHAFIPKRLSIESGDMGVLYGNLLDNAIEACMRMEYGERFIEFETKYQAEKLLITIRNSKVPEVNPEFLTSKKDKHIHGRGIKTVKKISEKYKGALLLEDKGDVFEACLLFIGIKCLE